MKGGGDRLELHCVIVCSKILLVSQLLGDMLVMMTMDGKKSEFYLYPRFLVSCILPELPELIIYDTQYV